MQSGYLFRFGRASLSAVFEDYAPDYDYWLEERYRSRRGRSCSKNSLPRS